MGCYYCIANPICQMSPKERFLETPFVKPHLDLVVSTGFLVAVDYALLELVYSMPPATDPSKGWDSYSQISGAKRFIEILRTIAEPQRAAEKQFVPSLNYGLKSK